MGNGKNSRTRSGKERKGGMQNALAELRVEACKLEKGGRRQEEVSIAVENWENAGGEHRAG